MMQPADLRYEKLSGVLNRIAGTKGKRHVTIDRAWSMLAGIPFVALIEQAGSAGRMKRLPLSTLPLAEWFSEPHESARRSSLEVRRRATAITGSGFDDSLTRW